MKRIVAVACAVWVLTPFAVLAQEEEGAAPEEQKKADEPSRWVFRGGLNLDLNQSFNIGGTNDGGAAVNGGVNVGVGYYLIPTKLTLDLDADMYFQLSPKVDISTLQLTPGARYEILPNVLIRAGVPIVLLKTFGLGVLGGVAYLQPLGGKAALEVGVDYTYWLTEEYRANAPGGRISVHAGVRTWF